MGPLAVMSGQLNLKCCSLFGPQPLTSMLVPRVRWWVSVRLLELARLKVTDPPPWPIDRKQADRLLGVKGGFYVWALLLVLGCLIPIMAVLVLVTSTAVQGLVSIWAKLVMRIFLSVLSMTYSLLSEP